jgi:hypothetical protein
MRTSLANLEGIEGQAEVVVIGRDGSVAASYGRILQVPQRSQKEKAANGR